jgi:hypothetical protein
MEFDLRAKKVILPVVQENHLNIRRRSQAAC